MSEGTAINVPQNATQAEFFRKVGEALKQARGLLDVTITSGRKRYAIASCTFGMLYPDDCEMRLERLDLIPLPPL